MASEPVKIPEPIRFGEDFEFDLESYTLRRSGRVLKLERIPMEILLFLVEQRGQLVSRDQIVEKIWGKGVFLDTDNSINSAIRKIRQVLRDDPEQPRFIQTITGRGYRFIASVEEVAGPGNTETPTESLLGKKISYYRVLQFLGGGGMGVVYKAEDLKLGRQVAIKFLPAELAHDPRAFERFEQEARATSALEHRNICSIYQLGEYEEQPFIVMQLLDGQTLRDLIGKGDRPGTRDRLRELLDLAIQIADGLDAAHQKGIIHRDIKPANVFITHAGEVKILDFGIAKFLEGPGWGPEAPVTASETGAPENLTLTRTGASVGTPSYLSPEQIRGEKLDGRTDLFSLGLVLYELATGERAFAGETATVIRDAVLNMPAQPVRELNPEVPSELEQIIGKALEKDRERRYQSARELRADLEHLEARLKPARGALWIAGTAVAAVLLAALAWGLYVRFSNRPPFQNIAMTQLTNLGRVQVAAISRDGKYVAYAVDEIGETPRLDITGGQLKESLWIRQVSGGNVQVIPPMEARYGQLVFSPDGDFLYFVRIESDERKVGRVYKMPVLGGAAQQILTGVAQPYGLALSADGSRVAFISEANGGEESRLMVANADGSALTQIAVRKSPAGFEHVSWSPFGNAITTFGFDNEKGVDYGIPVEISVPGGQERALTSTRWFGYWGLAWLTDGRGLIVADQEQNSGPVKLSYLSSRSGETRRITSDLGNYEGVSVTADSRTLATIQILTADVIWVGPLANPGRTAPVKSDAVFPVWGSNDEIIYETESPSLKGNVWWRMRPDGSQSQELVVNQGGRDFIPRVTPDQRYLIFVSERSGSDHVWRMDIDGTNPRQLTFSPNDALHTPDCSPDGKWVLYTKTGPEKGIWKVPIEGGEPIRLNDADATTPSVSPDGKLIAYSYQRTPNAPSTLAIMRFEGGQNIGEIETPVRQTRWTPDGRSLLFIRNQGGVSNLWSQPISGGSAKQLTHFNTDRIYSFNLSRDGKRVALGRSRVRQDVVLIRDVE